MLKSGQIIEEINCDKIKAEEKLVNKNKTIKRRRRASPKTQTKNTLNNK